MNGFDAFQDRVARASIHRGDPRSLLMILSIMALPPLLIPRVAKNLLTEPSEIIITLIIKIQFFPDTLDAIEWVGRRTGTDYRTTAFKVIDQGSGLLIRQIHEARVEEEQIRFFQHLEVRNVVHSSTDSTILV